MSGELLNSRFFDEAYEDISYEDIERVSTLKEDIWSTACELTMLILSISVIFSVTVIQGH